MPSVKYIERIIFLGYFLNLNSALFCKQLFRFLKTKKHYRRIYIENLYLINSSSIHGKNGFDEGSSILLDQKIILLNYQNNLVRIKNN